MADDKTQETREPESEEKETEAPSPAKKGGLKQYAILAGIIVVQVIAAYFLQRTFLFQASASAEAHSLEIDKKAEGEGNHADEEHAKGEMVMIEEIVVNPAGTGGRRFLAIKIGFEVIAEDLLDVEQRKPLIRDGLIGLLSAKRISELADIAYRDTLREEIRQKIEHELKPLEITRVFFMGFVLQ